MSAIRDRSLAAIAALVLFSGGVARAQSLSMAPATQVVVAGSVIEVDVVVSGLGNVAVPSVGAFDVTLLFDPSVLELSDVTFGDLLGDPGIEAVTGSGVVAGSLNAFEVSLLTPAVLIGLQPDTFTLVQLRFVALSRGTSVIEIKPSSVLADELGDVLTVELVDGRVEVTTVVAPAMSVAGLVLLVLVLLVPAAVRLRTKPSLRRLGAQVSGVLVLVSLIGLPRAVHAGAPIPGDIDADMTVDRDDLDLLLAARNTPAAGPDDARDIDGDGTITVLDARKLVLLCTWPLCATVPPPTPTSTLTATSTSTPTSTGTATPTNTVTVTPTPLAAGESCSLGEECASDHCAMDHDGVGSWCAETLDCAHDGVIFADGAVSSDCSDPNTENVCTGGEWQLSGCPADTACSTYACSDGACTLTQEGPSVECNPIQICLPTFGDDAYQPHPGSATVGSFSCTGFCDGAGSCDYASGCMVADECQQAGALPLGSVCGDESLFEFGFCSDQCVTGPSLSRRGEGWFKVDVQECDSGAICSWDLRLRARLAPPTAIDYDLYLYDSDGNLLDWSINVSSQLEEVSGTVDGSFSDDSTFFLLEVRYAAGESVEDWVLTTQGGCPDGWGDWP